MSKSNSHNKLNTLSMVPENGRAEIHHPQPGGTTEQEKVVEDVPKSITEHQKGGMRGGYLSVPLVLWLFGPVWKQKNDFI